MNNSKKFQQQLQELHISDQSRQKEQADDPEIEKIKEASKKYTNRLALAEMKRKENYTYCTQNPDDKDGKEQLKIVNITRILKK